MLKCPYLMKCEDEGMGKKLESVANDHFFDAILSLETREECYQFFEDVCTRFC